MSQVTIAAAPYNLFDPEAIANPYPLYQRLRTEAPVYWHEGMQAWLISRYADTIDLLLDPRFTTVIPSPPDDVEREQRRRILEMVSKLLDFVEPPNHARLRGLMEKAFLPKIAGMRERLQQLVDGWLDAVQGSGRMDIIKDLAEPLPLTVIAELLGAPVEDGAQLSQWAVDLGRVIGNAPTTPEEDQQILQNLLVMTDYFRALVEQRRQEPKDDLITALVLIEEQGDKLSEQEILINIGLLFAAGTGTPTYLIGNGLLSLLRHPDQMQKLQDDPTLIGSAIEEFLRYESPLQWAIRFASEDIELHGQLIRKDQTVLVGLGAANHDEARFPDPDRLDITRQDNRHLAFGYGPHFCLGAPLLRLQAQIAINTVLRRLSGLRLETDSLEWVLAPAFRALKSLPVTFGI